MIMAYVERKRGLATRVKARRGMGSILDDLSAALNVASDPYASEVVCRIQQLGQIKAGTAVQNCNQTISGLPGGIGLDNVATGLRYYVFVEQNPWAWYVGGAAIVGLPFLLGYFLGKP